MADKTPETVQDEIAQALDEVYTKNTNNINKELGIILGYLKSHPVKTVEKMRASLLLIMKHIKDLPKKKVLNFEKLFGEFYNQVLKEILESKTPENLGKSDARDEELCSLTGMICALLFSDSTQRQMMAATILLEGLKNYRLQKLSEVLGLDKYLEMVFQGIEFIFRSPAAPAKLKAIELTRKFIFQSESESEAKKPEDKSNELRTRCLLQYYKAMATESEEVRLASVKSLILDKTSKTWEVDLLFERLKDIKATVRIEVLNTLIRCKLPISKLNLAQLHLLTDICLHSRDKQLKKQFLAYIFPQIFDYSSDVQTIPEDFKLVYLGKFVQRFDYELMRYLPRAHENALELLTQVVLLLGYEGMNRLLRHVVDAHLRGQSLLKATTPELMVMFVLLDIGVNKEDLYPRSGLSKTVSLYFPEYQHLQPMLYQLLQESLGSDLLKSYYVLKLLHLRVKFTENDRGSLLGNLDSISKKLAIKRYTLGEEYAYLCKKFPEILKKPELAELNGITSSSRFRETYFLQKPGAPPLLLSSVDLFRTVAKTYRHLLSDNSSQFTNRLINLVSDEFGNKPSKSRRKEIEEITIKLAKVNAERHSFLLSRYRKLDKQLRVYDDMKSKLVKSLNSAKYQYFAPLKKSVVMLDATLELVEFRRDDTILQGLGPFLVQIMEDALLDPEYCILVHKALSKYLLVDTNKFLNLFDIFYKLLTEEPEQTADEEDRENLKILQSLSYRLFYDALFIHNLQPALNAQRIPRSSSENLRVSFDDLLQQLAKGLFSKDARAVEHSVEGFSRLVLHQRLPEPIDVITYLLLLWHDKNVKKISGAVPQFLTTFFNYFTSSKAESAETFEEAFERLFQLLIQLMSAGLKFNPEKVSLPLDYGDAIPLLLKTQVVLLRFDRNAVLKQWRLSEDKQNISPSERLFAFLIHSTNQLKKGRLRSKVAELLEKTIPLFDFFLHSPQDILLALHQIAKQLQASLAQEGLPTPALQTIIAEMETKIDEHSRRLSDPHNQEQALMQAADLKEMVQDHLEKFEAGFSDSHKAGAFFLKQCKFMGLVSSQDDDWQCETSSVSRSIAESGADNLLLDDLVVISKDLARAPTVVRAVSSDESPPPIARRTGTKH